MRKLFLFSCLFCLLLVPALFAQGPVQDRVIVDLPQPVTVQDTTLEPGEYIIQEPVSMTQSPVLQIFRDGGMVFETHVMTINALDNQTPSETKVTLQQIGNDYYLDKMWIAGKTYGYQFVLPDKVKERQEEMRESSISARVEHGQTLSNEANQAGQSAENAGNAAQQNAEQAGNKVEQGAESAASTVKEGAGNAAGAVESGARDAAGAVQQGAESAANAVTEQPSANQPEANQAQSAAGNAEQSAGNAGNAVEQGAENAGNAVQNGAESAANRAQEGVNSAGNAIERGASSAEREAEQAGVNPPDENNNVVAQNRGMDQPGQQPGNAQSELPQTASPLPLIALLGLGSLATGAVSRLRRRK